MADPRERLLFVRLGSLGDLVLTTPVVRAARQAFPSSFIAVLTSTHLSAVFESNPHVDEVLTVDRRRLDRSPREITHAVSLLRQRGFDVSVDLQGKPKTALLTWAARVPTRIGPSWWDTSPVANCPERHVSAEALAWLAPLGVRSDDIKPEVFVSSQDDAAAERLLQREKIGREGRPILGIFPGAGRAAKRWPAVRFAEIAVRATAHADVDVVVVGGPEDGSIVAELAGRARCTPFVGLPLGQLAGVLRRCGLFLSNDSGPMHVAVAVETPTVALFGPTRPERFGHSHKPHRTLTAQEEGPPSPDARGSRLTGTDIARISTDRVWQTLLEMGFGRRCGVMRATRRSRPKPDEPA